MATCKDCLHIDVCAHRYEKLYKGAKVEDLNHCCTKIKDRNKYAEVVRCKDCKYYTEQKKRCDHPCQDWDVECYDQWLEMKPDDFCSYGERRTDEQTKI